jgi:hypothetical protein
LKPPNINSSVSTDAKITKQALAAYNDYPDNKNNNSRADKNPLFDQKLDIATDGLSLII